MPQRASNDTLIIAGALLFGLLSLALPFAAIIWAPDSEFGKRPRPKSSASSTLIRNPRSADLKGERLAFGGNCAVGDFKDHREIEDTIRRQFATYRLGALEVHVTDACIAELHGTVRDARQRTEAIRAAGHPWVRAIDIADLRISAE
ncbi:MAG: hypothetical protein H6509_03450 [Bryobacterales bacterium]|nr:hypothetical protein [Bryobacterales bacterium]